MFEMIRGNHLYESKKSKQKVNIIKNTSYYIISVLQKHESECKKSRGQLKSSIKKIIIFSRLSVYNKLKILLIAM